MTSIQWYRSELNARNEQGDLFKRSPIVIPVKAGGQVYGSISQAAYRKGYKIPDLRLGQAQASKEEMAVYVCQWDENNEYGPGLIRSLVHAAMHKASLEDWQELYFPLLGGKEGHKYVQTMLEAMHDKEESLDHSDRPVPQGYLVTLSKLTL